MDPLLTTLLHDGEHFAETDLPSVNDLPRLFSGLVTRLGAELPNLAAHDVGEILTAAKAAAEAEAAGAGEQDGVHTSVTQNPVQAEPQVRQVAPSESAGTAAGGAPSESLADRLRRQADEAEYEEFQAQRQAAQATAAGAQTGSAIVDNGEQRAVQDSAQ